MIDHIARGEDAARLLGETLFKEAMAEIEKRAIEDAMKFAGKADATDDMRIALLRAQCTQDVRKHLEGLVTTGKQEVRRNEERRQAR